MTISAQTLELLLKAGVEGDSLVEIVRSMEAGAVRSTNAERQARYRERQRQHNVTSNVTPVTQQDERGNIDNNSDNTEIPSQDIATQRKKRGTRLPEDWQPPANCIEWWRSRGGSDSAFHMEQDKFRDWARAAPGSRGVKLDWDATFRNWLRNSIERYTTNAKPRTNSIAAGFAKINAALDERIRSEGGDTDRPEDPGSVPGLRQGTGRLPTLGH